MARKSPLLEKLAAPAAEVTDAPTTEASAPEFTGPPSLNIEDIKNEVKRYPDLSTIAAEMKKPSSEVVTPVTDPHQVWANLIRTPEGQRLTDSRIQSLSPQRFDFVFLDSLKSAFLAGWDARKGVEK